MTGWLATLTGLAAADPDADPVPLLAPVPDGRLARAEAAMRSLPEPVRVIGAALGRTTAFVAGLFF